VRQAKQERVAPLHQGAKAGADVVVPVRNRPSAVLESPVPIFVLSAWRLNDAIH
jgi:hypothetical protein